MADKIEALLPGSKMSEYHKLMILGFLSSMSDDDLCKTLATLEVEKAKLDQLAEKKKRVTMKYQVMIERLSDIELNKFK